MSTRSYVGFQDKDTGKIRAIYTHYDGYPDRVLPILNNHFTTAKKVEAIVERGQARWLDVPSEMEFYAEFGDEDIMIKEWDSLEAVDSAGMDYTYILVDGEWTWRNWLKEWNTKNMPGGDCCGS